MEILNENFGWGVDKIREFNGSLKTMLSDLVSSSKVSKEKYEEFKNSGWTDAELAAYFTKDPFSSDYIFTGNITDFNRTGQ
jgi:hypothetical protein